jgi:transaldolase
MKLFAAGSDPAELRRCAEEGVCDGVAVLGAAALEASSGEREPLLALGRAGAGPILVEVAAVGEARAIGRSLGALGPRFAARIPFAAGGAAAFAACKAAGVATNAFGCATMDEALAAARAGASWVSLALTGPAEGTTSGADHSAFRKTRALLRTLGLRAELLVGPLRDESVLFDSTVMGAHAALVGPAVLRQIASRRSAAARGS